MPIIYYSFYSPVSSSIPDVAAQEHSLGRQLLLEGLQKFYRITLSQKELKSRIQTGAMGKPFLPEYPGIHFNISHCDGLAVCAFHSRPIGVDAELPGYFAPILPKKALSPDEQRFLKSRAADPALEQEWFYRFWTLKEAYVKKTGTGADVDLTAFSFLYSGSEPPYRILCSDPAVSCWQMRLKRGHINSLCYEHTGDGIYAVSQNASVPEP